MAQVTRCKTLAKQLFGAWPAHRRAMLVLAAEAELNAATTTIEEIKSILLRVSGTALSSERRLQLTERCQTAAKIFETRANELAGGDDWQGGQMLRAAQYYADREADARASRGDFLMSDADQPLCSEVIKNALNDLARYLRSNQPAAGIEHVFIKYSAQLRAKVKRMVCGETEDFLHEVLLRLLITMKIRAWLGEIDALANAEQIAAVAFASIRNLALDAARHRTRWPEVELEPDRFLNSTTQDNDRGLTKDDLMKLGLTEREVKVINLRYWEGLSNAEIGIIIGGTATNVGVILHRAIVKMRGTLGH